MSETAPPTTKGPRRRRFAVSIRTLMLLVLAVAVGLGWKIHRAATQKRAVALVEKLGGFVLYDYAFDGIHPYNSKASPRGPAWLRARLGDEFFQEVTEVSFHKPVTDDQIAPVADFDQLLSFKLRGTRVTDAGLAHLARLKNLRDVTLDDTRITDAGLARLESLTGLRRLDLGQKGLSADEMKTGEVRKTFRELGSLTYQQKMGEVMRRRGTAITDAGLARVAGLTQLQELALSLPGITDDGLAIVGKLTDLRVLKLVNTNVNDAGLVHLKGLNHLRELTIMGEGVTDAGLAHLSGLIGLRTLALWFTRITDAGLAHLGRLDRLEVLDLLKSIDLSDDGLPALEKLKSLRELNLGGAMITDAGLPHLARLSGLRTLNLSANEITDAGLEHFRGMRQLRRLVLDNNRVTDEGIAALAEAAPELEVSHQINLIFAGPSARWERILRDWSEGPKKSHKDSKK